MKEYTTEPEKVHLNSDMETIRNHSIMKSIEQIELSKGYWRFKELKVQSQVQFYILRRCRPTKRTGICYLCLNKKPVIIYIYKVFSVEELMNFLLIINASK